MNLTQSFSKTSLDGSDILFPAFHPRESLCPPIRIYKNKLVEKRISDRAKECVSLVKPHPHYVAAAVSRLSGQAQVVAGGTVIGTPETPNDDFTDPGNAIALSGTKRREIMPSSRSIQLIQPNKRGRLESLKHLS